MTTSHLLKDWQITSVDYFQSPTATGFSDVGWFRRECLRSHHRRWLPTLVVVSFSIKLRLMAVVSPFCLLWCDGTSADGFSLFSPRLGSVWDESF